jgi:hypothetical protein
MNDNYFIGKRIKDGMSIDWTVVNMWQYKNYLCLGLQGTFNKDLMGGHRVKLYENSIFDY